MFESVALEAFKTVCKIYESHELLLTASGALAAGLPAGMWIQSLRHRYIFARFTSDFEAVRDKLAAAIAALEKERTRYDELLDYMRADRERQTSRPIVLETIDYVKLASEKETISEFNAYLLKPFRRFERRKRSTPKR